MPGPYFGIDLFGFVEAGPLAEQHEKVARSITSGSHAELEAAWNGYDALVESWIGLLRDDRAIAEIGVALAKAWIWYTAPDLVEFIRQYLAAEAMAARLGRELPQRAHDTFTHTTAHPVTNAEFLQARGDYDGALNLYIEREQGQIADSERGWINFRMAQCYWALLTRDDDPPDSQEQEGLREGLDGSIQTALLHLQGLKQEAWVMRPGDKRPGRQAGIYALAPGPAAMRATK